ncbi:hypothetical protein [Providencia rettgeri]|uniref:hypothetical protein n=1 Tax=Providencia rettgeri TaxID=587 RepID=UPI0034E05E96
MMRPDATLPSAKRIPNKFNLFHNIVFSLSVGLISFVILFYLPILKNSHRLIAITFFSFIISLSIFLFCYLLYIQKLSYINQWNLEREQLIKEKIDLKKRKITGNLIFTMTALGDYGNSLFALTNNSLLKQIEKADKSITKISNIPILTTQNNMERFSGIFDHFLIRNSASISRIASEKQKRLVIIDNINESYKEIIIEKVNKILSKNISDQIQFLPPNKLNAFINKQANLQATPSIFLLGIQINTETSYFSEAIILIELLSNSKEHEPKIHQSPENNLDLCIENVLSFGGNIPYAIENIWYCNIDEFEITQILDKLTTLGISPPPNLVNVNKIFGDTNELSDLLLISLALEQTKKNNLPQLIINTESMHNARIISNNHR